MLLFIITDEPPVVKSVFYLYHYMINKRNPTNANEQKLKKAQRELTHTKKRNTNTFKARSVN